MKTMQKVIVLLLVLAMAVSCLPMGVLATEAEEIPQVELVPEETAPEEVEVPEETEAVVDETEPGIEETEPATAEPESVAQEEAVNTETDPSIVDSGTCGKNLTWTRDSNGVLTISGTGKMTDYQLGYRNPPWGQIIQIKHIVVGEGVTHIGNNAFIHLNYVVSAELPSTLTSIGSYAFKRCLALEEIALPAGLLEIGTEAFENCSKIQRIEIPAGVTSLFSTFKCCYGLKEVVLHEGLTTIGPKAFYDTALKSITIPNSVTSIDSYAFQGCDFTEITLPAQLTSLGEQVFRSQYLEEITFLGDPPSFQEGSLSGFHGIVRYPAENPAWTADLRKDYDGFITWVDLKHMHNFVEVDIAPSCAYSGYTGLQCTSCGGRIRGSYTGMLPDHDLVGATCTEPMRCQREGCTFTQGEPLGHTWQNPDASPLICKTCGITDTHKHEFKETVTTPNCTEQGYTTFVCTFCNYKYIGNYVDALGHTPGTPNCTTGAICEVCGIVCEAPIPHEYSTEWNQGNIYGHWHDCKNCDAYKDHEDHIPNVEFATNKTAKYCTVCGFVIEQQRDYSKVTVIAKGLWDGGPVSWKITSDGVLTISGKTHIQQMTEYIWKDYSDIITRIVVSDGITDIPEECFSDMQNVTSVYLGNKVKNIGKRAFQNCKKLNAVTIPASVVTIDMRAFSGCSNLVSLKFASGSKLKTIYDSAFAGTGITQLTTPASLKVIKGHAFENCTALRNLHLTNGLEELTYYAFAGCTGLKNLYIPESLTDLDGHVFDNAATLERVECHSYVAIAFSNSKNLKHVVLTGTAFRVVDEAFVNCTALEEVILGPNINTIGSSVFEGSSVQTIIFQGDAPTFHDFAFRGVTATAEYPGNNPTWTKDKLQNYKGNITWVNSDHTYDSKTVAPTCTEQGYTIHTCSDCGKVMIDSYVDALGHTGGTATCINKAICERCGVAYGDVNLTNHMQTELQNVKTANCTEDGYSGDLLCLDCSTVVILGEVVPAHHTYTITVIPPTYIKPGHTEYLCSICGHSYQDNFTKALGLPKPASVKANTDPVTGGALLTWEHDGEASCYKVYQATSSKGKYKVVATVTEATAVVSVPAGKTYYFKVKAICEEDDSLNSGYSAVVKATGKCGQPQVTAEAGSTGKPVIKWSKVTGAKKYDVYRATSADGKYTKVTTTTKLTYTDTKATSGRTYFYKVKAIASKSTYNSGYSEIVSCRTLLAKPALTVTVSSTTGKPTLSWKKVTGADAYRIYRAEAEDGAFILLKEQTALTYTDTTAAIDTDYWYKVEAVDEADKANNSESSVKKVHTTIAKPNVTFKVDSVTGKPILTWDAVEGAVEYKVYRSTSSTKSFKVVKTTTELEYTDTSVSAGKGYYYKVIAIGENSKSAYSTCKKLTGKCGQPVITVAVGSTGKPVVKWRKISGAKKYDVYRATSESGKYTKVKTITTTSYTDTTAKVGTTYFYKVKAVASKSTYNSGYSEIQSCLTILGRPTLTLKTESSTGKPTLTWNKISGAEKYEIYRSVNDGEFTLVKTQTGITYTDQDTVVDGKYTYKVKAVGKDSALNSQDSVEKTIYCACAKPVIKVKLSGKKPMVSWESVDGAVKYEVYRSTKSGSGFKKVATVTDCSYTDSTAKKGTTYYYKVAAISASTSSAQSAYVKIKSN